MKTVMGTVNFHIYVTKHIIKTVEVGGRRQKKPQVGRGHWKGAREHKSTWQKTDDTKMSMLIRGGGMEKTTKAGGDHTSSKQEEIQEGEVRR